MGTQWTVTLYRYQKGVFSIILKESLSKTNQVSLHLTALCDTRNAIIYILK